VTNGYHAVVWINHAEAKIHRFDGQHELEMDLHSHTSLQRLHHTRTGWEAGGNAPDDTEFFGRINGALEHSEGTVITGPGNAKSALKAFLDHVRPNVASHVLAVEAMDDLPPADALLALGRRYFVNADPTLSATEKSRAPP
jgi:stalled ribosome rescue protein Dom34